MADRILDHTQQQLEIFKDISPITGLSDKKNSRYFSVFPILSFSGVAYDLLSDEVSDVPISFREYVM